MSQRPFLFATGCSGINSCAVAWEPLGWVEAFCAEVEPFPAAVLAHRFGSGRPETMPDPSLAANSKDRQSRKAARKTIQRIPQIRPGSPPNLGDITRPDFVARAKEVLAGRHLDVLCMGTPCQGYSVAGLRGSMKDPRSNLMFCFVEAYHGLGADFAVWENVPGCLNTPDNAFGNLLGGLSRTPVPLVGPYPEEPGRWPSSGIFDGPAGGGAWRVLDAEFLGGCELHGHGAVPQRRERVFVVFSSGAEGCARSAAVLFEPRGQGRDSEAECQAGSETAAHAGLGDAGVAKAVTARQTSGRADPTAETYVIESGGGVGAAGDSGAVRADLKGDPNGPAVHIAVHPTLDANCAHGPVRNGIGACVVECATGQVTHALKAEGADGSEDGTGRGVPIVAVPATACPVDDAACFDPYNNTVTPKASTLGSNCGQSRGSDKQTATGGLAADGVLPLTVVNARQDPVYSATAQPLDANGYSQAMVYDMRGNGEGGTSPTLTGDHCSRPTDYTPVVVEEVAPKCFTQNQSGDVLTGDVLTGDVAPAMGTNANASGRNTPKLYALMPQNSGKDFKAKESGVSQPVMAAGPATGNQGGDLIDDQVPAEAIAFVQNSRSEVRMMGGHGSDDGAVSSEPGAQQQTCLAAAEGPVYVVRRFTCRETERLQGFPDDWTLIPWAGTKRRGADIEDQRAYLAASGYTPAQVEELVHCPDGPRYKAVGNSKAIPAVRWIGRRIQMVMESSK